jgi:quercetin dioxygenase-like cupin family protein
VLDVRQRVSDIVQRVKKLLAESGVRVPGEADLEISHHYGIERFDEVGTTLITVVNREYCKKLIISLPGQLHPEQYHHKKEETFHVLYGEVKIALDGVEKVYVPGDVITVEREVRHRFSSATGTVIEEISSSHFRDDSFYTDPAIMSNKSRKTLLTHWMG